MCKWILLVTIVFFSKTSVANVDIKSACDEKKQQQRSLLAKMSTSLKEAHLAGQCTGYKKYKKIDWKISCSEFMEQKNSLLGSLSTSLSEAYLAGMCVGAIFRVAEVCQVEPFNIDYFRVAEEALRHRTAKQLLGCFGDQYGS